MLAVLPDSVHSAVSGKAGLIWFFRLFLSFADHAGIQVEPFLTALPASRRGFVLPEGAAVPWRGPDCGASGVGCRVRYALTCGQRLAFAGA